MNGKESIERRRWTEWWAQGRPGALSTEAFQASMEQWVKTDGHSGPEPSEKLSAYTALNAVRMRRVVKTYKMSEPMKALLDGGRCAGQHWVLITESWCGDAAHSTPLVGIWAQRAGVTLHWVLRDGGNGLIDDFLTRGGKSVPIWIVADEEGKVLHCWGPRPQPAMEMVLQYRNAPEPKSPYSEFAAEVQLWYSRDKGQTFEKEAFEMLAFE